MYTFTCMDTQCFMVYPSLSDNTLLLASSTAVLYACTYPLNVHVCTCMYIHMYIMFMHMYHKVTHKIDGFTNKKDSSLSLRAVR